MKNSEENIFSKINNRIDSFMDVVSDIGAVVFILFIRLVLFIIFIWIIKLIILC